MKQFFVLLFMMLALGGCGGDVPELEDPINTMEDGPGASNNNGGGVTGSLPGTWRYVFSSSGCIEELTFSSGGSFLISSLDEEARGTYTIRLVDGSQIRYMLVLTYTSDNSGADCVGISDDDTNDVVTKYYEIESNRLNFYSTPSSAGIVRSYVRI